MKKSRGQDPIIPFSYSECRLESFTSFSQLFGFIFRTYDGCYLLTLSFAYILWGIYTAYKSPKSWPLNSLTLLAYPILLLVVYIRHRIGTLSSDRAASIFCSISLTALGIIPVYITFWM